MARRYLLGFDVGSSSVKASLTDVDSGEIAASAFYPDHEAPIMAVKAGWAEQDPQMWWDNAKLSLQKIMAETGGLESACQLRDKDRNNRRCEIRRYRIGSRYRLPHDRYSRLPPADRG